MCVGIARSWCETCRNSPDCMSGSSCMCNQSIVSLMDDEVARPPLWGRRRKRKRKQLSCFSFDRESINDRDRSNVYVCARSIRCVQPLVLRPAARRRRLAISPFGPRRGSCPFPLASWPASARKAPGTNRKPGSVPRIPPRNVFYLSAPTRKMCDWPIKCAFGLPRKLG